MKLAAAYWGFWALANSAHAAETYGWVICQPGDYVNARINASGRSEIVGRYDAGDMVILDGKRKNGFLHVVDASFEVDECWVCEGYIVYDKPVYIGGDIFTVTSNGRLAARKRIGGQRRKWLNNGDEIRVWYMSDAWCVTDQGFVKTEYIDLN